MADEHDERKPSRPDPDATAERDDRTVRSGGPTIPPGGGRADDATVRADAPLPVPERDPDEDDRTLAIAAPPPPPGAPRMAPSSAAKPPDATTARMTRPRAPQAPPTPAGAPPGQGRDAVTARGSSAPSAAPTAAPTARASVPDAVSTSGPRAAATTAAPLAGSGGTAAAGPEAGPAPLDDATVVRPRPQRRPRLVTTRPEGGGVRELALEKAETTLGRASTNDVVFANPEVSRAHAKIVGRGAEHVLQPVGTRSNTFVNGEPVTAERPLRHGDVIELASERIVYAEREDTPALPGAAIPSRARAPLVAAGALALLGLGALAIALVGRAPTAPPEVPVPAPVAAPVAAGPPADAEQPDTRPASAPPEIAPQEPPTPERDPAPGADVAALLYQGDIAFLEKRYTTPTEGSAVFAYAKVLALEPTNARAREQIARIVEDYLRWAEAALARRDLRQARLYADKAAYVHAQAPSGGDPAVIERRLAELSRGLEVHGAR